jgi:hypothetical protein
VTPCSVVVGCQSFWGPSCLRLQETLHGVIVKKNSYVCMYLCMYVLCLYICMCGCACVRVYSHPWITIATLCLYQHVIDRHRAVNEINFYCHNARGHGPINFASSALSHYLFPLSAPIIGGVPSHAGDWLFGLTEQHFTFGLKLQSMLGLQEANY